MKYGRQLTISREGDVLTAHEQIYANYDTVKDVVLCTETVPIRNEKQMLAEFLKLMDRQTNGDIDLIGIQLLRDKKTGNLRVEKSWSPNLS